MKNSDIKKQIGAVIKRCVARGDDYRAEIDLCAILADLDSDLPATPANTNMTPALSKTSGESSEGSLNRKAGGAGGHRSCEGCATLHPTGWNCIEHPYCHDLTNSFCGNFLRRNWTPKQPKPTPEQVMKDYDVAIQKATMANQPEPATPPCPTCGDVKCMTESAAPVEFTACEICGCDTMTLTTRLICDGCYMGYSKLDDSRVRAWESVYHQCVQLGMTQGRNINGEQQVCEFIRGLAGKRMEETKAASVKYKPGDI